MIEVTSLIKNTFFSRKPRFQFQIDYHTKWVALLLPILTVTSVWAGPTGGNVTEGVASITRESSTITNIDQSSDRAVIDWSSFNVNEGELVSFVQPSTTSVTVNRDISGQLSSINGDITANGQIFILNSAGVSFGPDAFVNVGGLVASDLDSAEQLVGSGDFVLTDFNNAGGGVSNEGVLRANSGGIALVGQQIINSGEVRTTAGDAQLIAAAEVNVLVSGDGIIGFELTEPVRNLLAGSDYLIENDFEGAVVTIDGGDIVYSTRFVEDLLSGGSSVNQEGVETVAGYLTQAGDIYVSEVPVAETTVETMLDNVVATSATIVDIDASAAASEIDSDSESLAEADTQELKDRVNGKERAKGKDKKGKEKRLAAKIDPSYFAKLRKTHIDQLIPDCNGAQCGNKQVMKEFLGKLLVDGNL